MADVIYEIAAKRAADEPLVVDIGGEDYKFQPGPRAGIILSAWFDPSNAGKAQLAWLREGLEPEDWDRLIERCVSRDDPLDLEDLIGVVGKLIEAVAGRPTGRSPG